MPFTAKEHIHGRSARIRQRHETYVQALAIREGILGPDDLAAGETYYSMGYTLQNNHALDRALQCFEESLSIRIFNLGDDSKEVGSLPILWRIALSSRRTWALSRHSCADNYSGTYIIIGSRSFHPAYRYDIYEYKKIVSDTNTQ